MHSALFCCKNCNLASRPPSVLASLGPLGLWWMDMCARRRCCLGCRRFSKLSIDFISKVTPTKEKMSMESVIQIKQLTAKQLSTRRRTTSTHPLSKFAQSPLWLTLPSIDVWHACPPNAQSQTVASCSPHSSRPQLRRWESDLLGVQ